MTVFVKAKGTEPWKGCDPKEIGLGRVERGTSSLAQSRESTKDDEISLGTLCFQTIVGVSGLTHRKKDCSVN